MTLRSLVGEHIKNENGVRKNNSYTKLHESLNKDGVVIKESTTTSKSPKSGDTTRCVNVMDNLGCPQVRMDNQQRFVDKTMI